MEFLGLEIGSWADWFGAIGTILAVWIAVSYRRTKTKFDVDATVRAKAQQSGQKKPKFEIDVFNINDPAVLIKDIEIVYEGTVISNFLNDSPILLKGFEATRIDSEKVQNWVNNMIEYKFLEQQNPKIIVVLAGNKKRKFKINFVNEADA